MRNSLNILFIFPLVLVGCKLSKQLKLEPESFLKWYSSEENSFKSSDTLNGICYSISAYPQEVSIAICAMNKCEPKQTLETDLKNKSQLNTYLLELTNLNSKGDLFSLGASKGMSRNEQLIYLNNDIKYALKAVTESGDTLVCVSVIYEPLLANSFRLMIDFESSKSVSIDRIIYADRLINNSLIEFQFKNNNRSNFPHLNLTNYE
ncbi:hypothetical protein [Fluviicola taffensis]|uniref:Lipoprotein n=1 Tax=Fluviicola taffensis (strain DSM 16823 / NCIMB 13979 / RW262) TaxID=755732 RepID=F2IEX8_FLUTR|nr:hypothetical protein [Fluviicola taffensis]AEA42443.1 hypothetical protein Fluta_0437 [Fluviicola taffensis DSM 16823]